MFQLWLVLNIPTGANKCLNSVKKISKICENYWKVFENAGKLEEIRIKFAVSLKKLSKMLQSFKLFKKST